MFFFCPFSKGWLWPFYQGLYINFLVQLKCSRWQTQGEAGATKSKRLGPKSCSINMLPCHGPTSWFEGGPLDYFEKQCLNTHPHTFEPVVEPLKPLPHSPLHFRLLFPNPLKFSYPSTPKNYKGAYPNLYYTTKNKRFITKKALLGNPVPNPTATFFLVLYLSENLFGCPSL